MKKLLIPIVAVLFAACHQKDSKPKDTSIKAEIHVSSIAKNTPIDPIIAIRHKVEHINTQKLNTKHVEFMCDEKMMVDYYYKNGAIVKIVVDFGTVGDVYAREDYYYDQGKLIFVYEFVEGGPACEGCIKTNEYRSYIQNDNVVKYLKDKSLQKCRKCSFGPSSKECKLLGSSTAEEVKAILCR